MRKILGIDPGIRNTGWSVITLEEYNIKLIGNGSISIDSRLNTNDRLFKLFCKLNKIIKDFSPNEAAIEEIFINKNPKSSITLCYARGIALLSLTVAKLSITEYKANFVKKSITGNGHADKKQVMYMVKQITQNSDIKCHNSSDATAVAICHAYSKRKIS
ncbi:crossover junction endodeoxyribonuclease RuvC [Candidatus Mesenet endosymbiont of Agriotes lineatus]|uniref:crossover junction endodeoxyribonuclease RuvC n=1 Tax=Candidatus Mesenet endosymbiont of Agriotes lineatus TaxID=3077948 RepID=UPI0030CD8F3A